MTYICNKTGRRDRLEECLDPHNPKELSYLLETVCMNFFERVGADSDSYVSAVGALECAKLKMCEKKTEYKKNE